MSPDLGPVAILRAEKIEGMASRFSYLCVVDVNLHLLRLPGVLGV